MKNYALIENAFKNAWQVDIKENETGLEVGRSKVPYSMIETYLGELLKDAIECLWGDENLPKWQEGGETIEEFYYSLLANHLTISSTQNAQFRARAFDRIRTYWAVESYLGGENRAMEKLRKIIK